MENMKNNGNSEDEVDLLELTVTPFAPADGANEQFATETNVFSIEFAKKPFLDSGIFEIRAPDTAIDSGIFEIGAVKEEYTAKEEEAAVLESGVFEIDTVKEEAAAKEEEEAAVLESGVFEIDTVKEEVAAKEEEAAVLESGVFEIGFANAASAPAEPTPELVLSKIAHVCLYVKNLEKSVEFYKKLGFKKRFSFNRDGRLFGVYLEFGAGNFLELFEDPTRATGTNGSLAHFCLETPDIDAAVKALSAMGIGHTPKKSGCDGTYQIWLKDPDGNDFELHQYTPGSSQLVGGDVVADW